MTRPAANTAPSLLSADQPRRTPAEDLFEFAPFGKLLAQTVMRGSPAAGFVVAIYAEWGMGKSTLLNFVQHYIEADVDDDPAIVIRFNPWWFSGREDLLRRFFKEFEHAVLASKAKRRQLEAALKKFSEALAIVPHPGAGTVAKALDFVGRLALPQDVIALRDELARALAANASRIVVLIDDIDRLLPDEMVDIFRLIRSVGDLPNVHYVLAFDRAVVVNGLFRICGVDGHAYLEKIVQAPFRLPKIGPTALQRQFLVGLDRIFEGTDSELLRPDDWDRLFLEVVAPLLRTPRDVARLVNTLTVLYPPMKNEVNAVDFVILEALAMFVPEAYDTIRENRHRLTDGLVAARQVREADKAFHQEWIRTLRPDHAFAVRTALGALFPRVAQEDDIDRQADRDRGMRRVCVDSMFDLYFQYSNEGPLSRTAFRRTFSMSTDMFAAELERLANLVVAGTTGIRWFLQSTLDSLSIQNPRPDLLVQLCSLSRLQDESVVPGFMSDEALLVQVIAKALRRLPRDQRLAALQVALDHAELPRRFDIVVLLCREHGRLRGRAAMPEDRTIPSRETVDLLGETLCEQLLPAIQGGELYAWPRFRARFEACVALGMRPQLCAGVRAWVERDHRNVGRLVRSFSNNEGVDLVSLACCVDLLDAEVLLHKLTAEPVDQSRVATMASNAMADVALMQEIVRHVLECARREGWYPSAHTLRNRFAGREVVVDHLVASGALREIGGGLYAATVVGLQIAAGHPQARREFIVAKTLMGALRDAHHSSAAPNAPIPLVALQAQHGIELGTLAEVQRAAMVLLLLGIGVQLHYDDHGFPLTAYAQEAIRTRNLLDEPY